MEVLNYSTNYKGTSPLSMLRELVEWVAREIQEKSKYLKKMWHGLEQQTQGDECAIDKDVAGGHAQHAVQRPSLPYPAQLGIGFEMEGQVAQDGQKGGKPMTVQEEEGSQEARRKSQKEIEQPTATASDENDQGALARPAVVVDVTIVVDNKEGVDDQTACQGSQQAFRGDALCSLRQGKEAGHRDGNHTEEQQDEQVAHSHIGEMGGVEEAEDDAERPHSNHRPTAIEHQGKPDEACHSRCQQQCPTHSGGGNPPLRAGAEGPQTVFAVVAPKEVKVVVDEIGIDLHDKGKKEAQQSGNGTDGSPAFYESHGQAYHHGNSSPREGLRTSRQDPGSCGIWADEFFFLPHRLIYWLLICKITYKTVYLQKFNVLLPWTVSM